MAAPKTNTGGARDRVAEPDAPTATDAPRVTGDTPVTDAPPEQRDLGGNPPERTPPLDTPDDRSKVTGPVDTGKLVEVVLDASGPVRVSLNLYPGSRLNVPGHVAAELLAASPQFRRAEVSDKFPGLRPGDEGEGAEVKSGYEHGTNSVRNAAAKRGAGPFDPAVVAANMPSIGEGNERSTAYADEVLKAARVTEEGIRSGRDVAATIVGPEFTDEPGRDVTTEDVGDEAELPEDKLRRMVGRG